MLEGKCLLVFIKTLLDLSIKDDVTSQRKLADGKAF